MKTLNYFMMALFVYSAVVQLNDPNPWPWVVVYGVALVLSGLWMTGRMPVIPAFAFSAGCLVFGLILLVQALMRDVWVWDEHMNQPAGLLVVFLWVSSLAWIGWKERAVS